MKSLKLQPRRRHIAAGLTIALATGFVAFVVLAVSLLDASVRNSFDEQYQGMDVQVIGVTPASADGTIPFTDPSELESIEGVDAAFFAPDFAFAFIMEPGSTVPTDGTLPSGVSANLTSPRPGVDYGISEGRLPTKPGEAVIDETTAKRFNARIGSTLPATSIFDNSATSLTIVGIKKPSLGMMFSGSSSGELIVSDGDIVRMSTPDNSDGSQGFVSLGVQISSGTSEEAMVKKLEAAGYEAMGITQLRQDAQAQILSSLVAMSAVLGAFVAIALATSVLVVTNSFAVTMAQRRRSFALARALGATRAQAMASVVRDALLVGVFGSLFGIAGAYVLYTVLINLGHATLSRAFPQVPGLNLVAILLPLFAGVLLALVASIAPALSTFKVTPLEALRPREATHSRGASRLQVVLSLGLMLVGAVGMALAVLITAVAGETQYAMLAMLVAVLGGLLFLIGCLWLLPAVMRPLMRVLGRIAAPVGRTSARFAGLNAARHPRRTATTVAALVIGSGLMVMMSTGAATAQRTLVQDLTNRMPFDVIVSADSFPSGAEATVKKIAGVEDAAEIPSVEFPFGDDRTMTAFAPTKDQLTRISQRQGLESLVHDGEVLMGSDRAEQFGLTDGGTFTVTSRDGSKKTLKVRTEGSLDLSVLTPRTLEDLNVDTTKGFIAKLSPEGNPSRKNRSAMEIIQDVSMTLTPPDSTTQNVYLQKGEGAMRELYATIINVLLIATFVLLAIAVLVALVGVANTLSLSVVERSGENALLRALGTARRQVQAMLAWEGIFISIIGAVIGIVLGVVFGFVGTYTLLGSLAQFEPVVPWDQFLVVLVLALAAGLIASVVPGWKASQAQPAQALAQRDE